MVLNSDTVRSLLQKVTEAAVKVGDKTGSANLLLEAERNLLRELGLEPLVEAVESVDSPSMRREYTYRWVHKVSQICVCGHSQNSHHRSRTPVDPPAYSGDVKRDSPVWGEGACMMARCATKPVGDHDGSTPCLEFRPGDVGKVSLPSELPTDRQGWTKLLRDVKLLGPKLRLRDWRKEHDKIVCFPHDSTWHSIILEPAVEGV